MKEIDVEDLMTSYRDSIGACSRQPVRVRNLARWPRRLAYGLAATMALGGVALWPRDAVAAAMKRIDSAIKNAHTMEMDFWIQSPSGRWSKLQHVLYRDGMWRSENLMGSARAVTQTVRGGQELTDYVNLDHATLGPVGGFSMGEDTGAPKTALEYAEESLDPGNANFKHTLKVSDHAPVNGVPAYLVTMERAEDDFHAEILVDRRSDLPIQGEVIVTYRKGTKEQRQARYRQEYRFGTPIDDGLFSLERSKPVIKVAEARMDWLRVHARPIATSSGCEVLDASVASDGTVWMAVEAKNDGAKPSRVLSENGFEYVRAPDKYPEGASDEPTVATGGKSVFFVPFVPMNSDAPIPTSLKVLFSERSMVNGGIPRYPLVEEKAAGSAVRVKVRSEPGLRPEWITAFGLDGYGFHLETVAWEVRARTFEKRSDFQSASAAYERCAIAYRGFVKYGAYRPLEAAARCYEAMGRPLDAASALRRAAELKADREF